MLCEIQYLGNAFGTWLAITSIMGIITMILSGLIFHRYYVRPTYEQWRFKSNPKYPSPGMVKSEIVQMWKGMATATMLPTLSLYLAQQGLSQAYCGWSPYGAWYHVFEFMVVWIGSDFYEFYYHRLGHTTDNGWKQHKHHHFFYNPSPFAVIADEYIDQFVRSAPLAILPIIMPMNIDLMLLEFGIFFYGYGVYLHWGYELAWPNAHTPIINTAFQHYCHHAISIKNRPLHTGFFFKLWDDMFGSVYTGKCFCAKCAQERGERTQEEFAKIEKPDYSVLLQPSFWYHRSFTPDIKAQ